MEGKMVRCCHCDGTGTMDGPGGPEECCHCRGKGERWFASESDADVARADLNHEARRVDPALDIGGGHGTPGPDAPPIGRVMFWLIATLILLVVLAVAIASIWGAGKP